MALMSDFRTRKWVKPFIAFLALTLISILAYENVTSRFGSGIVLFEHGDQQIADRSVSRGYDSHLQTPEQRVTVSRSETSRPLSAYTNSTDAPDAARNGNVRIGGKCCHSTSTHSLAAGSEVANTSHYSNSNALPYAIGKENSKGSTFNTPKINRMYTNLSVPTTNSPAPFLVSKITKEPVTASKMSHQNNINHHEERTMNLRESLEHTRNKPVFIVLLARMRTGSTLIGEIFNQNEDVGFLYEPLHALCDWYRRGMVSKSKFSSTATTLLNKLSVCDFTPNFISSIWHWPTGGGPRSSLIYPVCAITNSCRHASSKILRHHCMKFQKYRGVKTIRADLDMLHPIIEKGAVDVKILHLIRDPRGTANSRRIVLSSDSNVMQRRLASRGNIRNRILIEGNRRIITNGRQTDPFRGDVSRYSPTIRNGRYAYAPIHGTRLDVLGLLNKADVFPLLNTIPAYCKWLRSTIDTTQRMPDWLRGRYKLIRYEDYAADPLLVTEDIYRYFGMVLPDGVRQWVTNNTSEDIQGNDRLYGSHRNSTQTAFKWRREMLSQEAQQVERECGDVMERLGYLRTSPGLRLGDTRHSLIRPLPKDIPVEL